MTFSFQLNKMAEEGEIKPKQPDRTHAERVVKILEHIAECLPDKDVTAMYTALTLTVKSLNKSDEQFRKDLQNFIKELIFKPGVSASLLKQAVRGILIVRDNQQLVLTIYDMLGKKFPSFPIIMEGLGDENFRAYLEALLKGDEKMRHIRLMVVGMYGVGKTCLIRRIRNESIEDVCRTVGIDVSLKACKVSENGSWVSRNEPTSSTDNEYGKRLANIELRQEGENDNKELSHDESVRQLQSDSRPIPRTQKTEIFEEDFYRKAKHTFENLKEANQPGIKKFKEDVQKLHGSVGDKKTETKNLTGRETTVSIWDFAGQSIYYSTHHFFLSSRAIYLLVLDISEDLDKPVDSSDTDDKLLHDEEASILQGCLPNGYSRGDAFRFWINSIYTYARGENRKGETHVQMQTSYKPKIILVATHKDRLKGMTDMQKKIRRDEFFRKALGSFIEGHPARQLICDKWFLVSCTEDRNDVFDNLKAYIYKISQEPPFWDEPIPARWIPLERDLVSLKAPIIKYKDLEQMNENTELPLENTAKIKSFLLFQHLLGNILYYDVQNLDETIVLDPQWIIDIFKLFITHQENTGGLEIAWNKYKEHAILDSELIQYIWKKEGRNEVAYHEVIEFMKHLGVITNPLTDKADEPKEKFFIVPCMLKKMTNEEAKKEHRKKIFQPSTKDAKTTSVLCFVFEIGFLPPPVFHQLLASCIREWKICTLEREDHDGKVKVENLLFEGVGVFNLDDKRTLTIWYAEYVIYMRIALYSQPEMINAQDCKAVKDKLSQMLQSILLLGRQKWPNVEDKDFSSVFDEHILCPKNLERSVDIFFKKASNKHLHNVKYLKENEWFCCGCSGENHSVHSHDLLHYWYPLPSDRDCALLSDLIGKEYRKLGSNLNLDSDWLERIYENPKYTNRTKSYKILIEARKMKYCTEDDLRKAIEEAKKTV